MEVVVRPVILQLLNFGVICIALVVQGSAVTGSPNTNGVVAYLSPTTPVVSPSYNTAPPPSNFEEHLPSMTPITPPIKVPLDKTPVPQPQVAPVASPPRNFPQIYAPESNAPVPEPIIAASPPQTMAPEPPAVHPINPRTSPSIVPVPVASPPRGLPQNSPTTNPVMPVEPPTLVPEPNDAPASFPPPTMPVAAPPNGTPEAVRPVKPYPARVPSVSPASTPSFRTPVAAPPNELPQPVPPINSHPKASVPAVAPSKHKVPSHSNDAPVPTDLSPNSISNWVHSPASSPSDTVDMNNHLKNKTTSPAPASSYLVYPPASEHEGPVPPVIPPALLPKTRRRHHAPPSLNPGSHVSPAPSPSPVAESGHTKMSHGSPVPSLSPIAASGNTKIPFVTPKASPTRPSLVNPKMPPLIPVLALPPPPPNEDCSETICTEPYTNTPPGSPCGCVWPMQVALRLSVPLYTFFPLVSELAKEIAAGVFMKQSQVRIVGANAANQQPEKTVVLVDLVPLGEKIDTTTAFWTYDRFWHKQVVINGFYFGDYEVLYVRYPGLPPSPPSAPTDISIIDTGPYHGNESNGGTIKPIGVDVHRKQNKGVLSGGVIAIIALSAFLLLVFFSIAIWILLFKCREKNYKSLPTPQALQPLARPAGMAGSMVGSALTSASLSFGSSIVTYTGSAKTYSTSEIEKATAKFDASRILGEGGFGLVYSGVLEDGTKVAVKVLKRDDQQGGREFLAEVEMLSRLHHRNLVKLIGICTEERNRCLVYELIPNGSVESHLHGVDKTTAPLDWGSRMKIALGAARGLAYLHEDSSPRVIHRDFKSSNILLEHDFTPKVSDFGLARIALEEENGHISTRVMGTFGYVAPEYAMTGHLLVKSDVYSYGVVLLELLSGRKPVDMSQPSGQENLVAWARPLLSSKEGLETIIDASLGSDVPFDNVAKVAAIASMCVQPEVSHRPFMGEVVQALKLVCNECDETKEVGSRGSSQEDLSIDIDAAGSTGGSGQLPFQFQRQYSGPNYESRVDIERGMMVSELHGTSLRFERPESRSFRRESSSGPLRTGRGRRFWQSMRRLSGGSVSEHGVMLSLWRGSN